MATAECAAKTDTRQPHGADMIYHDLALDPNNQEIRLLRLAPASESGCITCTLSRASLQSSPRPVYEAVSYTWGDSHDRRDIVLNGNMVKVTFNLWSALRRLQHAHEPRLLWVDALCINQTDLDEREQQVRLMGDVFSRCEQAVIWIGEPPAQFLPSRRMHWWGDERDVEALETYLQDFGRGEAFDYVFHAFAALRLGAVAHLDRHPLFSAMTDGQGAYLPSSHDEYAVQICEVLESFSNSPWWTRVWTIQESILPPRATLTFGPVSIDLVYLVDALTSLFHHSAADCCSEPFQRSPAAGVIGALHHKLEVVGLWREVRREGRHVPLWPLLPTFWERRATDDRDRVYGVLGLASAPALEPNYKADAAELYRLVAVDALLTSRSLLALHYPLQKEAYPNLPSWVNDWTVTKNFVYSNAFRWASGLLRTEFGVPPREPFHLGVLAGATILELKGRRCDVVTSVSPICSGESIAERRQAYCQWFQHAGLVQAPSAPYVAGGTRFYAWQKCLYWDLNYDCDAAGKMQWNRAGHEDGYGRFLDWARLSPRSPFDAQGLAPEARAEVLRLEPRLDGGDDEFGSSLGYVALHDYLISQTTSHAVMFTTARGYLGVGPPETRVGDEVWRLVGGWTPFVLRPGVGSMLGSGKGMHSVLGVCYVHGMMDGEVEGDSGIPVELVYLA